MNFYYYRLKNKERQVDAGKVIGIDRKTYAKREKNPQEFRLGEAIKLAKHYGVSLSELVGDE